MAKGKYLKKSKAPLSYKAKKFFMKNLYKFASKMSEIEHSPKYKMSKDTKRKMHALIAASAISLSTMPPLQSSTAEQEQIVPAPEQEIIYTIGIPNENAEITVDGKNYTIDKNSFVIVSEEEALAYDVHGNMLKGHISTTDFKEVMKMSEEEMANYNHIYQITSDIDVNVRSSGEILNTNIISTVPSYNYVLGYDEVTLKNDKEWIQTLSINDGYLYTGYIREDLMKEIDTFEAINNRVDSQMDNMENIMYVNTSGDEFIPLNLRSEPVAYSSQNIIAKIPYGSIVRTLGRRQESNGRIWANVSYETLDGIQFQGWVSEEYLSEEISPEKENHQDGIPINPQNITGIDFSAISANNLQEFLENGIPNTANSKHGTIDTSQLAGEVNYAYIKLGASPYGKGEFKPTEYNYYEEQIAICEKLGIPYGFYYYSTAITVEEAKIELDYIKQCMDYLKQNYDLKYNKFEIAVDIELENKSDRQYGGDIKQKTEAKAALINGIFEQELSDYVLIYGPMRVMKPDLDQIIDLQYLHTLLSNPDKVALWQCSPMQKNGNAQKSLEDDIAYAEEQGFSTVMYQLVLDAKFGDRIDINSMIKEHFDKMTNKEIENIYEEDER